MATLQHTKAAAPACLAFTKNVAARPAARAARPAALKQAAAPRRAQVAAGEPIAAQASALTDLIADPGGGSSSGQLRGGAAAAGAEAKGAARRCSHQLARPNTPAPSPAPPAVAAPAASTNGAASTSVPSAAKPMDIVSGGEGGLTGAPGAVLLGRPPFGSSSAPHSFLPGPASASNPACVRAPPLRRCLCLLRWRPGGEAQGRHRPRRFPPFFGSRTRPPREPPACKPQAPAPSAPP